MYASSSPFGPHRNPGAVYRRVGVETELNSADAHRMVAMLFDGVMESLNIAHGAMRAGHVELKGRALSRAVRIVEEGLKCALNLEAGGRLANDLNDLYAYATLRLTQANLRNDAKAIEEVQRLIEPLRDAWKAISPAADAR